MPKSKSRINTARGMKQCGSKHWEKVLSWELIKKVKEYKPAEKYLGDASREC